MWYLYNRFAANNFEISFPKINFKSNIYELLNAVPGNMLVVNQKGDILFANKNAIATLGYQDFPNIVEILPSTINKGILRYIERCLKNNEEIYDFETPKLMMPIFFRAKFL